MVNGHPRLKLGFVALCDCAPLVVAKERGFFAEQGLSVELSREPSWANIRDKVAAGTLHGAGMLATMPFSASLGLGNISAPLVTGMALSQGGNAITVSTELYLRMRAADPAAMEESPISARALKAVIAQDRATGLPPLRFATVYPISPHTYELRRWMLAAGIDPDRDVRLVVVPPSRMVATLSAGNIVGYCVGEPWNTLASNLGLGRVLIRSHEIWQGRLEKVFAVRQDWLDENSATHHALLKALVLSAKWCDENRAEVATLIAQPLYLNTPIEVVRAVLESSAISFYASAATFPWHSQGLWYLNEMRRSRVLADDAVSVETVARTYRTDLYRAAANELGLPYPLVNQKVEGQHPEPWTLTEASAPIAMTADRFFDGSLFDPEAVPRTTHAPRLQA